MIIALFTPVAYAYLLQSYVRLFVLTNFVQSISYIHSSTEIHHTINTCMTFLTEMRFCTSEAVASHVEVEIFFGK